jgi:tRNA(fMet)-specific endonuclease VapC
LTYLLDTNACIGFLNGRSRVVLEKLEATPDDQVRVCSVVKAEMIYGAMKSRDPTRAVRVQRSFFSRYRSLPFDDAAADVYGRIRAELESEGTPIGPNDLLIAAIAVANDLTLVTHNTNEFSRVTGLVLEDWEA